MVIAAANEDIFTFLNGERNLTVAADLRVVTAMGKRRRMVLSPLITSGRAEAYAGTSAPG